MFKYAQTECSTLFEFVCTLIFVVFAASRIRGDLTSADLYLWHVSLVDSSSIFARAALTFLWTFLVCCLGFPTLSLSTAPTAPNFLIIQRFWWPAAKSGEALATNVGVWMVLNCWCKPSICDRQCDAVSFTVSRRCCSVTFPSTAPEIATIAARKTAHMAKCPSHRRCRTTTCVSSSCVFLHVSLCYCVCTECLCAEVLFSLHGSRSLVFVSMVECDLFCKKIAFKETCTSDATKQQSR